VRVGSNGILRVLGNGYTVPSGLKGKRVQVRVYEWEIEVWYANQRVDSLPRLTGMKRYRINYRHVIDSLLRKPGGFRDYRYRDDLFPQAVFRQAWEALCQRLPPRKADLAYLRILKLAAGGLETDVAAVLGGLLASPEAWDDTQVTERVGGSATALPALQAQTVDLQEYDQLLRQAGAYVTA
jgi:hypothetical protein